MTNAVYRAEHGLSRRTKFVEQNRVCRAERNILYRLRFVAKTVAGMDSIVYRAIHFQYNNRQIAITTLIIHCAYTETE